MNYLKISKLLFIPALAVGFLAGCNDGGDSQETTEEEKFENIHWVDAAANTLPILKSGKHMGNTVDYVLTAEPVFTNAKTQLDEGVSLVETYDIRKEWKALTSQEMMVQAGLFVRKSTLADPAGKLGVEKFVAKVEENIASVLDMEKLPGVVSKLNEHTIDEQKTRFGYNANLVNALQKDNKNRFALVSKEKEPDVNTFVTTLGMEAYPESYFVEVGSPAEEESPVAPKDVKVLSPQGAPALALYSEYANANYETKTDPKLVNAELQKNEYDIIVAPVYGAMKAIKQFSCDFALARVLTGGNFYLVGVNKTADDKPTKDDYIVGFAETDVTGMSFKKLYKDLWSK